MAYQTLYRKWRPTNFDEVVGQSHITSTLKNEIINNKTAHAYIFTGTRGTGKTSTAKILSRAINCERPVDGNPCNECPSCIGIINETILDVVEMDAASNTGVENIREIIDQVRYTTAGTKYKVYIIDEVHMLSMGAFNALLKTLEEPPAHVVFILATTEIHKIPATILSRCQRFDFKNIGSSDIADAVGSILEREGVDITRDAVEYIAYLGNGSMRDALSITEQCLAYKQNNISYADVTEILGTLDDAFLYNAAECIARGSTRELMLLFDESIKKGKNPASFAEGLLKVMRDILLYKLAPEVCDFTSGKRQHTERTAPLFTKEKLTRCIDILSAALRDIKLTSNSSVLVECTFIRMSSPEYESDVNSILDRISVLERRLDELLVNGVPVSTTGVSDNKINEPSAFKPIRMDKQADTEPVPAVSEPVSIISTPISDKSDIVDNWRSVIEELEHSGKLITFVSLYGVTPRMESDILMLPFETKEAANKFANSSGVSDVKEIIMRIFGTEPEIKCIWEEKTSVNLPKNDDIFKKIAEISTNNPENFKID